MVAASASLRHRSRSLAAATRLHADRSSGSRPGGNRRARTDLQEWPDPPARPCRRFPRGGNDASGHGRVESGWRGDRPGVAGRSGARALRARPWRSARPQCSCGLLVQRRPAGPCALAVAGQGGFVAREDVQDHQRDRAEDDREDRPARHGCGRRSGPCARRRSRRRPRRPPPRMRKPVPTRVGVSTGDGPPGACGAARACRHADGARGRARIRPAVGGGPGVSGLGATGLSTGRAARGTWAAATGRRRRGSRARRRRSRSASWAGITVVANALASAWTEPGLVGLVLGVLERARPRRRAGRPGRTPSRTRR